MSSNEQNFNSLGGVGISDFYGSTVHLPNYFSGFDGYSNYSLQSLYNPYHTVPETKFSRKNNNLMQNNGNTFPVYHMFPENNNNAQTKDSLPTSPNMLPTSSQCVPQSQTILPTKTLPHFQTTDHMISNSLELNDSDCSDDDDLTPNTHPNKFPVILEEHYSKFCCYRRQPTRSGEKVKVKPLTTTNPETYIQETHLQKTKYYVKHLVRICKCGQFEQTDGVFQQGRTNDCDGYEIHYSQKCKWKAYDDYYSGKRVLIRLCKCYKPQ